MAKRGTYFHFFGGFRWVVERSGVFQQLHRVGGGEGEGEEGWISSASFQRGGGWVSNHFLGFQWAKRGSNSGEKKLNRTVRREQSGSSSLPVGPPV